MLRAMAGMRRGVGLSVYVLAPAVSLPTDAVFLCIAGNVALTHERRGPLALASAGLPCRSRWLAGCLVVGLHVGLDSG